ncbi:MAG TPA: polysaccharide biosynthesis tyrosine autokinase [Vicinamibacterales bacterium]|nr:polysaccharide biosynthesis tyrosine autokinase [Vicinamibacterales bacterium]
MFDAQDLPANVGTDVPTPSLSSGSSQPVHLLDRLNAVFKHRRLAGTAFVLVIALMMLQTYSTTPVFQAQARVQIQDERTMSVANITSNDPAFWQDAEQYYKTQYSILQSRGLARRVVERLRLAQHPDFSGSAPRPRDPLSIMRQARASAGSWVRSLVAKPPEAEQARPAPDEDERLSGLISAFLGGVHVVPEQGTRLVTIIYRHHNPRFAAEAANALADEYTRQNLDLRLNTIQTSLKWIDGELARQEEILTKSEAALSQYRESNNAQSLDDKQNIVTARLTNVNDQLTRARGARLTRETLYNQIRNADPKEDASDNFPAIGNNASVVSAKNALLKAEGERAALVAQGYGPEWPALKAAESEVAAARRQLVAARGSVIETARNEFNAARLEESNYAGALEEAKSASVDLERKGGDYKILQRKAETDRTLYNQLLTQQKELSVVANSRANNVQVMEQAEVPKAPISPNPRKDWLTALLAGVVVAFGLAFGIEYLDDTVKVPEDITRRLRLPLLGLVPAIKGDRVPVLSETVPHEFGEAFRSLRTSLVFTAGSEHTRVIAVTSSQPLEGKTTTAANLAMALALGGSRVLLIDADMRRPGLHKTLGMENGTGLSHLLTGQARVREAIQRTAEPNLVVITAGRTPPNPSELLASERMNGFLQNLQTGPFDWVVIDTPPVLAVTDAVILAPRVSGVVFVIGSEMTRRAHAERAIETLRTSRPRSLTAVLNRVDFNRNKYYYSRYYGYQYKSYYGPGTTQGAA